MQDTAPPDKGPRRNAGQSSTLPKSASPVPFPSLRRHTERFRRPVSVFLRDGPGSLKRPLRHIPFTEQLRPRPKASVHEGISCVRSLRKHTGRSSFAPLPSSSRDSFGEPHENLHGKVPTSHSFGKRRCLPHGTVFRSKNEFVARFLSFFFTIQPQAFQEVLLEEHPETPAAKSTVRAPCQTIPRVLSSNPGDILTLDARQPVKDSFCRINKPKFVALNSSRTSPVALRNETPRGGPSCPAFPGPPRQSGTLLRLILLHHFPRPAKPKEHPHPTTRARHRAPYPP